MAMRFETQDDDAIVSEINITPLTDIFLVLLIIFMISSSAMMESGLNVKLPQSKSSSTTATSEKKPTFVTITKSGDIQVNQITVTAEKLEESLKKAIEHSTEKSVVLRGDQGILLGKAVELMDLARRLGADKIAIATEPGASK